MFAVFLNPISTILSNIFLYFLFNFSLFSALKSISDNKNISCFFDSVCLFI